MGPRIIPGAVGTILMACDSVAAAYEVEFADSQGDTQNT